MTLPTPTPTPRAPLPKRILHVVGRVLRVMCVVAPCLIVLLIFALDLPVVRRQMAREITDALHTTFAGRVIIERIDHISLLGVSGVRVRVEDPSGVQVLLVENMSATVALASTVRSVLQKRGDMVIDVTSVKVSGVEGNVDADANGALRVARAFQPKESDEPKKEAGGRATVVHLRKILLDHAWVHGAPAKGTLIDADVDHVDVSLVVGGKDTIADLARLDVTGRHLADGIDLHARIEAHWAMPAPNGADQLGRVDVRGDVTGIAFHAEGAIDGQHVTGLLDVPKIAPSDVAKLSPGIELTDTVEAHADVEGVPPELHAKLHAGIGKGTLDLLAHATLNEKRIHVELNARDVDARVFARTAPETRLAAISTLDLRQAPSGNVDGTYTLDLPAGRAEGQSTPPVEIRGAMNVRSTSNGSSAISLTGDAKIAEAGAPTDLHFALRFPGGNAAPTASVEIVSRAADLGDTRLGGAFRGSATLEAKAQIILATPARVDATANLALLRVSAPDQTMGRGRLHATLHGAVDAPEFDAVFAGTDIEAGGMQFAEATLTARGNTAAAKVEAAVRPIDGPRVEITATVGIDRGPRLERGRIKVQNQDVSAIVQIASAKIDGSNLRADGISVEGLGEPAVFEFRKTAREISIKAQSTGLDLAKITRLLRTSRAPASSSDFRSGHLAFDIDLAVQKESARGHLQLDLEQAAFSRVKNGNAHFKADIAGRRIDTTLHANLGDAARVDSESGHLEFDSNKPLDLALLETARGNVGIDARVDIGQMKAFFPRGTLPFTDMQGVLRLKADVVRASAGDVPEMHVTAATGGLLLTGKGDRDERVGGSRVLPTPPWRIEGVDLEFAATLVRNTGASAVVARLFDKRGTIVAIEARSPAVPFRDWLRGKSLDLQALANTRFTADVTVPRRDLKQFPAILRTQQTGGAVLARIHAAGTLAEPDVHLEGQGIGVTLPYPKDLPPFDAKMDANFKDREGNVNVGIQAGNQDLLAIATKFEGELPIGSSASATPWTASTDVKVHELPLAMLSSITDVPLEGFLSVHLSVKGLHRDARANLQLAMRDLQVGRARFPRGVSRVDFDGQALRGHVRLDQSDGFLEADSELGMRWGADIVPALRTSEPTFATLKAHQFRIAALLPFTRSVFAGLDGRLQADARIDLAPNADPEIRADIALENGKIQLVRLGETLQDVTLHVKATPDGLVRVNQLTARGSRGKLDAKAVAHLKGFDLVSARANLGIPKNDAFPVDIDGQEIGDVDGDIEVAADASPDHRTLKVDVKIPRLHIELPLASSNTPQQLDDAPKIRVGHFRRPRQFILLPLVAPDVDDDPRDTPKPSTTTQVAVHLGDRVEVERGTTIRVAVTGEPRIEITDKARVSGQIRLARGILDVQGKRFEIEKGTVTFVGDDPGNPQIIVTAGWDAPDGTRVYADFVGPLKTGAVRLRSEPSRPQNEILALIMFGAAEGSSSTPYPQRQADGTTRAGAMAGGFATEGLSKGLDQLTGLDVSAKIDTSNSANPKPEIQVQIARDIAVQIAYVIGAPTPGMHPDRTFLTVDWRFRRNWSMETTFGDQGSSILDLLWRYRY